MLVIFLSSRLTSDGGLPGPIAVSSTCESAELQNLQTVGRIWPVLARGVGTGRALIKRVAARRYQDLIAWQLASAFSDEALRLVESNPAAQRAFKYSAELLESAESVPSNIAEGFLRFSSRELCRFIDIALGSLGEAETRLRRGIRRGFFKAADCEAAFKLGRRCLSASVALKKSQRNRGGG